MHVFKLEIIFKIQKLQAAYKENGQLKIISKEAFLLTQWLEKGIFPALEKGYLHSLIFCIYIKKQDVNKLLETYEFRVDYPNAESGEPGKINAVELTSKKNVKEQAGRFMRNLIEFVATLEDLPGDRWLTIQLQYKKHTPDDYEPEYFKAASDNEVMSRRNLPLVIMLGNMKTDHIGMHCRYAGLESFLESDINIFCDDEETNTVAKMNNSLFEGSKPQIFTATSAYDLNETHVNDTSNDVEVNHIIEEMKSLNRSKISKSRLNPSIESPNQNENNKPKRLTDSTPKRNDDRDEEDSNIESDSDDSVLNWVQCDDCKKWHNVPAHIDIELFEGYFVCSSNNWNKSQSKCLKRKGKHKNEKNEHISDNLDEKRSKCIKNSEMTPLSEEERRIAKMRHAPPAPKKDLSAVSKDVTITNISTVKANLTEFESLTDKNDNGKRPNCSNDEDKLLSQSSLNCSQSEQITKKLRRSIIKEPIHLMKA